MSESTDGKLKVLELFAGTRSIGRAFEERGHEVLSVDWDERFADIDLQMDVLELHADEVLEKLGKPDVMWPSFKPPCRNGDPCHDPAPRGAKTGTQGLKGAVDRSRIPRELCDHIVKICEAELCAERRCVTR